VVAIARIRRRQMNGSDLDEASLLDAVHLQRGFRSEREKISSVQCGQRREQQGGEDCEGVFHGVEIPLSQ
jgi:hypothetical protein